MENFSKLRQEFRVNYNLLNDPSMFEFQAAELQINEEVDEEELQCYFLQFYNLPDLVCMVKEIKQAVKEEFIDVTPNDSIEEDLLLGMQLI